MKTRIQNFARQLHQLYDGGSWVDESLTGKLKHIDEQAAFVQPSPGNHSVAEILWHCIYWRTVVLKRIEGDYKFEKRTEKDQNFLPLELLKGKGWKELLSDLKESQEKLMTMLNSNNDDFLETKLKAGYTTEFLIEGVIQHDYYHLGQIGLVISMLQAK